MVIATVFCFLGILTGGQWLVVAAAYGGLNYAQKLAQGIKNGDRSYN